METKTCTRCKKSKPITAFKRRKDRPLLEDSPGGWTSICRECLTAYGVWRYATKGKYRTQQREWSKRTYDNLKAQVIMAYGGKCVCCGEIEPLFLTVDHINGDGADKRRSGEGLGGALYLSLKRRGFPKDGYQLLCYNCNCSKRQFGVCPHQTARHRDKVEAVRQFLVSISK